MALKQVSLKKGDEVVIVEYLNGYFAQEIVAAAPFTKGRKTFSPDPAVSLLELTDADSVTVETTDFIEDVQGKKFYLISGPRPTNIRKR